MGSLLLFYTCWCLRVADWRLLLLLLQDIGHDPKNPNTRLYATSAAQPYHNDAEDIVGE